jgi:truncated hemoglobin YjbI
MSTIDPSTSDNPYQALGEVDGCRKLAIAFYARVAHDPVLRPLFPGSTFKCAIEGLSMYLAEFLGGPRQHTEARWSMSLVDMHERFRIGPKERDHWLEKMSQAMEDVQVGEPACSALKQFFEEASAYLIHQPAGGQKAPSVPIHPEIAQSWPEIARSWDVQRTLEDAAAAVRRGDATQAKALTDRLDGPHFLFLLGLMSGSAEPALIGYVRGKLLADPDLVHGRYSSGRTLLNGASGNGGIAIVQLLLELGADPNTADSSGHTPLYYAGNSCAAATGGDIVRALAAAGANVDAHSGVKHCTALHMAARRGHVPVAAALLDCGADIEARDRAGDTPLRRAVNCGKADVAELLLSRGADLHSVGSRGLTPLRASRGAAMQQLLRSYV